MPYLMCLTASLAFFAGHPWIGFAALGLAVVMAVIEETDDEDEDEPCA